MSESWPIADAPFARPEGPVARQRWQVQVERSLLEGALLLHEDVERGLVLDGDCPRCGHRITHTSLGGTRQGSNGFERTVRIVCNCEHHHHGRSGAQSGCGWAPDFDVAVAELATVPDG